MNIIFFGSSKYSTIDEKTLHQAFGLSLVVTLPDRKNAKTKQLTANPVKQYAAEQNIPFITTEKLTSDVIEQIKSVEPDFLVVADFGLILPKNLLELPKKAAINVHHSLLPKYRGPAPVPFAILAGEQTVGVTIILMTPHVDAGDMLAQETYALKSDDTTDSVLTKLNELGAHLAVQVLKDFDSYYAKRTPQNKSKATFTHYMKRENGFVTEKTDSKQIMRMIQAYYPWPGVWTKMQLNGKEKIVKLLPDDKLQVEGKNPMTKKDFLNGYPQTKEIVEKLLG